MELGVALCFFSFLFFLVFTKVKSQGCFYTYYLRNKKPECSLQYPFVSPSLSGFLVLRYLPPPLVVMSYQAQGDCVWHQLYLYTWLSGLPGGIHQWGLQQSCSNQQELLPHSNIIPSYNYGL